MVIDENKLGPDRLAAWIQVMTEEGLTIEERTLDLIREDARRAFEILRQRPKPKIERLVGRPALTEREKEVRRYARMLENVYQRRRDFLGPAAAAMLDGSENEWRELVANKDLAGLKEFQLRMPWASR